MLHGCKCVAATLGLTANPFLALGYLSISGFLSPDWMQSVALQDALPAVLTAVTQYNPALFGLICFITRLCFSPSALTTCKASLRISTLFFFHVTERGRGKNIHTHQNLPQKKTNIAQYELQRCAMNKAHRFLVFKVFYDTHFYVPS